MMPGSHFERAQALSEAGRPFATATVVRAERPTSGKPGDRAIITLDGRLTGWIGGSCAEPTVIREALRALADNSSRLIRLSPVPGSGPVPEGVIEAPMTCFSGGTLDIFIEPHQPRPRLLVAGSSPAAEALVRLGGAMGYHVVALDPGTSGPVPGAAETIRDVAALDGAVTPLTFVVVATHGSYDEPVLAAALRTAAPYVGLVSSPSRGEAIREALRQEGIEEDALLRLKVPAGLDIGARNGDEIAVSILAELIQVRARMQRVEWTADPAAGAKARAAAPGAGQPESGAAGVGRVESNAAAGEGPEAPAPAPPVVQLRTGPAAQARPPAGEATAIDPVCGMAVRVEGAANTLEHEGRIYYFCCGGCRRRFAADPAAFAVRA